MFPFDFEFPNEREMKIRPEQDHLSRDIFDQFPKFCAGNCPLK